MHLPVDLNQLSEAQLRQMAAQMLTRLNEQDAQLLERDEAIRRYRIRNEQLTHEIALLKRHRFGKRSEGINRQQYNLLEDLVDEDTAAIEQELERRKEAGQDLAQAQRTFGQRQHAVGVAHLAGALAAAAQGAQQRAVGGMRAEELVQLVVAGDRPAEPSRPQIAAAQRRLLVALETLRAGSRVNLELPLSPSAPLGGHFVQGHVDGTATLRSKRSPAPPSSSPSSTSACRASAGSNSRKN